MLNSKPEQFKLAEDGQILWQKQAGNPMPGEPVGRVVKGEHILKPVAEIFDDVEGDAAALQVCLQKWLEAHIATVLEDLVALDHLDNIEGLTDEAKEIATRLYDALGILPREDVQPLIATLDNDSRAPLRVKKIKMGPVLIFIYTLTKPAAVRLRALLWSLFHDKALPAAVPNDGMVSLKIEEDSIDPVYYRAIGYPVYASRAIRIDMVDRILNAIYESASEGKFKATHAMAEWLGCSIADLYDVLEAMGHKKIFDPADQPEEEKAEPQDEVKEDAADAQSEDQPAAEETKADAEKPAPDIKPELATFRLKKGAANSKAQGAKKPYKVESKKKPFKGKKGKGKPRDHGPKVMSATVEAKAEDSPFAILGQLK